MLVWRITTAACFEELWRARLRKSDTRRREGRRARERVKRKKEIIKYCSTLLQRDVRNKISL